MKDLVTLSDGALTAVSKGSQSASPVLCEIKLKLFCAEPENFQVLHLTLGLYSVLLSMLEKGAAMYAERDIRSTAAN